VSLLKNLASSGAFREVAVGAERAEVAGVVAAAVSRWRDVVDVAGRRSAFAADVAVALED
jgi:hypothetical protein